MIKCIDCKSDDVIRENDTRCENCNRINQFLSKKNKFIRNYLKRELISLNPNSDEAIKITDEIKKEREKQAKLRKERLKKHRKHIFKTIAKRFNRQYKTNISPLSFWSIAKKQKCLCALSGVKLTTENISVDHILPRSRGGSNDVANLRFLINVINIMRSNYNDADFILRCGEVYMNNKNKKAPEESGA